MRAVEIAAPGAADVLRLVDRPDPSPGPGEVLIAVEAAGVNRPDVLQRLGKYAPPPGASDLPGLEVAGRVAAVGPPVGGAPSRWTIGDAVCKSFLLEHSDLGRGIGRAKAHENRYFKSGE